MVYVLVSDAIEEQGLQPLLKLAEQYDVVSKSLADTTEEERQQVEALLVRSATKVTDDAMASLPNLKIIARAGVGVDNIDVQAATKRGIIVINAPDGNTISTAEHTFSMMASLNRHIPQAYASLKNGEWKRSAYTGRELYGKTLGIVGFGRIGGEVAKRAKVFGMNVFVYDPFLTKERADKIGVKTGTLEDVLREADIITVHTPLTKETRGLINEKTIALTKQGVRFINCARGGIIDEQALYDAIKSGHVAGAALDVFVEEPPAPDHPLLTLDEVIYTPHLGASTVEAQLNVAEQVAQEVVNYFAGKPVTSSVNLPSISKDEFEKIKPFYELSQKLGNLLSQCMPEPVQEISISYAGTVTELETGFISKSLLTGFLRPRVARTVNEVNALQIAKERTITFGEKFSDQTFGYPNLMTVKAKGEQSEFTIQATVIPHFGERVVNMNGFQIDFVPEGYLLYIQHTDRPGVIGKVGQLLGDQNINIATMHVGRKVAGGDAIMMLTFDEPLNDTAKHLLDSVSFITKVRKIDGVLA